MIQTTLLLVNPCVLQLFITLCMQKCLMLISCIINDWMQFTFLFKDYKVTRSSFTIFYKSSFSNLAFNFFKIYKTNLTQMVIVDETISTQVCLRRYESVCMFILSCSLIIVTYLSAYCHIHTVLLCAPIRR